MAYALWPPCSLITLATLLVEIQWAMDRTYSGTSTNLGFRAENVGKLALSLVTCNTQMSATPVLGYRPIEGILGLADAPRETMSQIKYENESRIAARLAPCFRARICCKIGRFATQPHHKMGSEA